MTERAAPTVRRTVVIGVGEPMRRDDGCGPRVVRGLRGRVGPDVELVERAVEPTALLDLWDGVPFVVVVDAVRSGSPAGTVVRLEDEGLAAALPTRTTSSHGLSVRDAFELGRAVGRLPARLVVYLIEAGEVGPGERLSAEVAAAVDRVVREIAADVGREGTALPG